MMMVRDLSHNGMQLNDGAMAISWQPIKYGDKLSFQEYSFEFLAPKATNQMTTARSENSSTPLTEQPTRMTNNAVTSHSSATRLLQSPLAPQSAMLLSRLVASPKRVSSPPNLNVSKPTRMPALMAHQNSTFDEDADEDEGDLGEAAPPSPSSGRLISRLTSSAPTTPKRHLSEDMGTATESKKVRFGPSLSPEIFSKDEPPATPVKRGESTRPGTPRRAPTSTATLLERLKTASPAKSIIASPQSQQRTANFSEYLERPRPLKFGENTVNQPRISAPTEEGRKTNHTDMSNPFAPTSPAPKTSSDEA
ncbi:hypothetical protein BGW41_003978 [Actinomortierella wolfii]|nr:hypothetical protein BGW41_003978 [Actinomortierella wolfii]